MAEGWSLIPGSREENGNEAVKTMGRRKAMKGNRVKGREKLNEKKN